MMMTPSLFTIYLLHAHPLVGFPLMARLEDVLMSGMFGWMLSAALLWFFLNA